MLKHLDGATRVHVIIGDPIAQVRSPAADVDGFIAAIGRARNVDGIVATVPHNFAAFRHCMQPANARRCSAQSTSCVVRYRLVGGAITPTAQALSRA